ncbi:hypothetical protein, partial [Bifidobacterium myosotis]|uniref:hypothetical protein n=1 Tax=Bifidobacterium myosotis TaxID=1630166 RepID=UPI001B804FFE
VWFGGLVWRSGLAVWFGGLVWRSGLAVWFGGLVWRSGSAVWFGGLNQTKTQSIRVLRYEDQTKKKGSVTPALT